MLAARSLWTSDSPFQATLAAKTDFQSIEKHIPKAVIFVLIIALITLILAVFTSANTGIDCTIVAIFVAIIVPVHGYGFRILTSASAPEQRLLSLSIYAFLVLVSASTLQIGTIAITSESRESLEAKNFLEIRSRSGSHQDPAEVVSKQQVLLSSVRTLSTCVFIGSLVVFTGVVSSIIEHYYQSQVEGRHLLEQNRFEHRLRNRVNSASHQAYHEITREHSKARHLARQMSRQLNMSMAMVTKSEMISGDSGSPNVLMMISESVATTSSTTAMTPVLKKHLRNQSSFGSLPTILPQFSNEMMQTTMKLPSAYETPE